MIKCKWLLALPALALFSLNADIRIMEMSGGSGGADTVARASIAVNTTEIAKKIDKFTDKASATDITAGTVGKWVDAKQLKDNAGGTPDTALSTTSTNPLQNKVIDTELDKRIPKADIATSAEVDTGTSATKIINTVQLKRKLDLKQNLSELVTTIRDSATATNTKYVSEKAIRALFDSLSFTGVYKGSSPTFAGLTSGANGDWAVLTAIDGTNKVGIYVTDGTNYTLVKEIADVASLTQLQVEDKTSTIFGTVSGQRLNQAINKTALTDAEATNKTTTKTGISSPKQWDLQLQGNKGGLAEIPDGTNAVAKGWDALTLNKGINELINSARFWDNNYAGYGDGSVTVNRMQDRIVIDPTDLKFYRAIVDSIPVNKQPKDNPAEWADVYKNSEPMRIVTTSKTALKALIAIEYQRAIIFPSKEEYVFYKTANLTAEQIANVNPPDENIVDDANSGMWVFQSSKDVITQTSTFKSLQLLDEKDISYDPSTTSTPLSIPSLLNADFLDIYPRDSWGSGGRSTDIIRIDLRRYGASGTRTGSQEVYNWSYSNGYQTITLNFDNNTMSAIENSRDVVYYRYTTWAIAQNGYVIPTASKIANEINITFTGDITTADGGKASVKSYEDVITKTILLDVPAGKQLDTISSGVIVDPVTGEIALSVPNGGGDTAINVVTKDYTPPLIKPAEIVISNTRTSNNWIALPANFKVLQIGFIDNRGYPERNAVAMTTLIQLQAVGTTGVVIKQKLNGIDYAFKIYFSNNSVKITDSHAGATNTYGAIRSIIAYF